MATLFKQIFCGLGNDGNSKASKQCKEMKCKKKGGWGRSNKWEKKKKISKPVDLSGINKSPD